MKQPIKTLSKCQNKCCNIKSTITVSKAQSQVNNLKNLAHSHGIYVHREKVLKFWLRNSIKLCHKESTTTGVLQK